MIPPILSLLNLGKPTNDERWWDLNFLLLIKSLRIKGNLTIQLLWTNSSFTNVNISTLFILGTYEFYVLVVVVLLIADRFKTFSEIMMQQTVFGFDFLFSIITSKLHMGSGSTSYLADLKLFCKEEFVHLSYVWSLELVRTYIKRFAAVNAAETDCTRCWLKCLYFSSKDINFNFNLKP